MYPDLAQEWHPIENGSLNPANMVPGSEHVVVWQCRVNPTHVYCIRDVTPERGKPLLFSVIEVIPALE